LFIATLDQDWIRIGIKTKLLDPDPESMNPDPPAPCVGLSQGATVKIVVVAVVVVLWRNQVGHHHVVPQAGRVAQHQATQQVSQFDLLIQ
jgi:hypothetical protein